MSASVRIRVVGVVVLAAALLVASPASAARAGVPAPPGTEEYCGRLVSLRDTVTGVRAAMTGPEVFAAIRKVAKEFRRVAADAPDMIADDMALLAKSFSNLDRALRPLASTIRPAENQADYDRMVARVSAVVTRWQGAQDQEAVNDAQAAVDRWLDNACGFRLSTTDSTTAPTTRAATGER